MSVQPTATTPVPSASDQQEGARTAATRQAAMIPDHWLRVVRPAWLVLAALGAGFFAASAPMVYYLQLQIATDPVVQANLRELGLVGAQYALLQTTLQLVSGTVCCAIAATIFWRKSDEVMPLFVAMLLITFGAAPPTTWLETLSTVWAVPASCLRFFGFASVAAFFFLFPSGRFVPRWTRWLALFWPVLPLLVVMFPTPPAPLRSFLGIMYPLSLLGMLGAFAFAQIYRYRRVSSQVERQQTKWLIFGVTSVAILGMLAGMLGVILPDMLQPGTLVQMVGSTLTQLAMLLIPVSLGVAILRYRLWDVDTIINRTLVYGALTAGIAGIYVLVVGGLGALLAGRPLDTAPARGHLALSLLATGFIAVFFQPLREHVQRGVDRLMYGERDDPYAVINRLGQRLEATLAPEAVLPTIVETVREALKLPYAAIVLIANVDEGSAGQGGGGNTRAFDEPHSVVAASGTPVADPLQVPLVYQGESISRLLLGARAVGETWSAADHRLLADFARQAGIAVHAVRLTAALQHARTQLVTAREEERRRLRRDLHDGLGPALGSLALEADIAHDLVRSDPARAEALLKDITAQAQTAVQDIRRLVYDLRPPALDDLGLVSALRALAANTERVGVDIVVDAPAEMPPLPAAVEVAAYRIVQEALTNVMRHAQAHRCVVQLALAGAHEQPGLSLTITDDGQGLSTDRRAGVGLTSMHERAAELGGSCSIGRGPTGGTRIEVWLPRM